jgi:pimeloyl-ACP methyl ester carboxylesterase
MDLRGRTDAGETGYWFGKHTYSYDIDAYINHDVDAAIDFVLKKSGAPKLNYIGHSMGGIIMHARLGSLNENRVANFVAIASPMSFLPYNHWTYKLYTMRGGMILLPVLPIRPMAAFGSLFPDFFYAPFLQAFFHPENTSSVVKNQLTAIPPAVMSLTNLRTIDLYYNKISNLDPGIGRLQNLRVLYLSHNNLSELPPSIGDLRLLEELYVHDNKLKSIPAEINQLSKLRVLRINNNFLYTLPDNLLPLQRLENLDVSHNYLFQFPDEWASLPKLQVLGLMSNPWDDKEALGKVVNTLREKGITCIYAGN